MPFRLKKTKKNHKEKSPKKLLSSGERSRLAYLKTLVEKERDDMLGKELKDSFEKFLGTQKKSTSKKHKAKKKSHTKKKMKKKVKAKK